jgi:hypothetical protein
LNPASCSSRWAASFPKPTKNMATKIIIRRGLKPVLIQPMCCAGPHGRSIWPVHIRLQAKAHAAEPTSGPTTGGGWINGRGDDTQTMFVGYGHIVDFFTGFDWWKTNPHDELVNSGNYCLADPGNLYVVYLPHAGKVTVKLEPGTYRAEWFNALPAAKEFRLLKTQPAPSWSSPDPPDDSGWAQYPRLGASAPKTMMHEIRLWHCFKNQLCICAQLNQLCVRARPGYRGTLRVGVACRKVHFGGSQGF